MKKPAKTLTAALLSALLLAGCAKPLTLYTDLPKEAVEGIAQAFTQETCIPVTVAVKTAGAILGTAGSGEDPCDVVMLSPDAVETMLALEDAGRLSPSMTANETGLPWAVSGDGFLGMGGDAWALIVNTDLLTGDLPDSIFHLDNYTAGMCGMPDPERYPFYLVGVYLGWDESLTVDFFMKMLENGVQFANSPSQAARMVSDGVWEIALTTLGDAMIVASRGGPVKIILPDQHANELGTLVVPTTVAVLNRTKINQNAGRLASWLVRPESEAALYAAGLICAPVRDIGADGATAVAVRPLPTRIGDIYRGVEEVGRKLADLLE